MMKPGMVYWLNNHVVYHGRDGWLDTSAAAAEEMASGGRLLFRTWLSPYNSRALPDTATFRKLWGNCAAGAVRGGLEPAVATGEFDANVLRAKLQVSELRVSRPAVACATASCT